MTGERRALGYSPGHGGAGSLVLRKQQSYGEAERSADPPARQSPPQARAGGVRLQRTRLRERDRWSSAGQSAAEGGGAKRWPKEDHRFLSLPHATKGAAHCPPRAAHPFPIILLTVQCFEMPSTEAARFFSDRGYLPGLLRWALHPMPWALLLFPGVGLAQSGGRDAWFPDAEYFSRPTASVREPTFALGVVWSTVFRDRADPARTPTVRPPGRKRAGDRPPGRGRARGQRADLAADAVGRWRADARSPGGGLRPLPPAGLEQRPRGLGLDRGSPCRDRARTLVRASTLSALERSRGRRADRAGSGTCRLYYRGRWKPWSHIARDDFRVYGGGSLVVRSSLENEVQLGPAFSDDVLIRFGADARVRPWDRDDVTVDGGVDWHKQRPHGVGGPAFRAARYRGSGRCPLGPS